MGTMSIDIGATLPGARRRQDTAELLQLIRGNTAYAIFVKVQHAYRDRGAIVTNRPEASPGPILPV